MSTTSWNDEQAGRAVLTALARPGDATIAGLVAKKGVQAALEALGCDGCDVTRTAAQLAEAAEHCGARLVCPGDSEWPPGLECLSQTGELDGCGGPPPALWLRGTVNLRHAAHLAVAVVGASAATSYGQNVASDLSAGLAELDITVVSVAALGVAAAALRSTLAAGGRTVAVLPCGVDIAFPRRQQRLLDGIAERGVLISESAPGTEPTRQAFLARIRIIVAKAAGTVVVEAPRGDRLSSAAWTLRCQRVLTAVPGPITSAESVGVHELIRAGEAYLVTSASEIAEAIDRHSSN